MQVTCEQCGGSIEDTEVDGCLTCGADGLCPVCATTHICEEEEEEEAREAQAEAEQRKAMKLSVMCEHMLALIEHCEQVGVRFGGCGDCGSPWLVCAHCGELTVHDAADAFGES